MQLFTLVLVAVAAASVFGDVYIHNPRGSNNRFTNPNENDNEVNNNNRLFDSQNNDDGGYETAVEFNGTSSSLMFYYASSILQVQWSSQHACGRESTTNCEIVLQYMCNDWVEEGTTNTQSNFQTNDTNLGSGVGVHENWYSYYMCVMRERNKGLYLSVETPNGNSAIYTRQEEAGTRRGIECNEERDYYPYWAPSNWIDVAILTGNTDRCEYYHNNTQNTNPKYYCVDTSSMMSTTTGYKTLENPTMDLPAYSAKMYLTQDQCQNAMTGAPIGTLMKWQGVAPHIGKRGQPATLKPNDPFWGAHLPSERGDCREWKRRAAAGEITNAQADALCNNALGGPECLETQWQRDNHHGYTVGKEGGDFPTYTWRIPDRVHNKCVLRLRYNISTEDYDGWNTFQESNGINGPITQDEIVRYNWAYPIELAINADQYGRTFEDRTHVFSIRPRPSIPANEAIYNLNVRGKRGNIAQTYPSPTFDFAPKYLNVPARSWVHFQWEGASTERTQNEGGGRPRSERHNLVQIKSMKHNTPLPAQEVTMFPGKGLDAVEKFAMALQDPTTCQTDASLQMTYNKTNPTGFDAVGVLWTMTRDEGNCGWLNRAPARFNYELIQYITPGKEYFFMSTRDNIPGRHSMKGMIKVQ